jgi:hypothetical protein
VVDLNQLKMHQFNHQLKRKKSMKLVYTNQERNLKDHTKILELFEKDLMLLEINTQWEHQAQD